MSRRRLRSESALPAPMRPVAGSSSGECEEHLDACIGSRGISVLASGYSRSSTALISEYASPPRLNQAPNPVKSKKHVDIAYQTRFAFSGPGAGARTSDPRPTVDARQLSGYVVQSATTKIQRTTSRWTGATPIFRSPIFSAAAEVMSIMLPGARMPRSFTRTTTERPLRRFVT